MKKRITALVLTLVMACGALTCGAAAGESDFEGYRLSDYKNGQVLIFYKNGEREVAEFSDRVSLAAGLAALSLRPGVEYFQPNLEYASLGTSLSMNDTYYKYQWYMYNSGSFSPSTAAVHEKSYSPFYKETYRSESYFDGRDPFTGKPAPTGMSVAGVDIDAGLAMGVYQPRAETVLAIIDTGIDYGHEDFGDVFWKNVDEIPENGLDDDSNGYTDDAIGWNFYDDCPYVYVGAEDGHGTHCAGTVVASANNSTGVSGLAGDGSVKIMPLKVLGESGGHGTTADVLSAIEYAAANGAHVVNMSFASEVYDRSVMVAIAASDMLFVAASGNNGRDITSGGAYPACYDLPNIIAVTAVSPDGQIYGNSNYSAEDVDIAAPGDYIVGLYAESGYAYMSGTSMAAPMVSAAAAMIHSQNPELGWSEIKDIILETATPMASLKGAVATGGMLDLGAALRKACTTGLRFEDVQGHWGENYVNAAVDMGLFSGTGPETFSPDGKMTRAMLAVALHRLAGCPEAKAAAPFPDVEADDYFAAAAAWAAEAGVITGSDGYFDPDGYVTRQQTAAMLFRFAGALKQDTSARRSLNAYPDKDKVASWASEAMSWTVASGIIAGRDNGKLDPAGTATRAESAAILVRFSSIME